MQLLKNFTAAATSPIFETTDADWVILHFVGTIDSGSLAIQCTADASSVASPVWTAFEPSGTAVVITTTLGAASDSDTRSYEVGGLRFRLVLTGGTTVAMKAYVQGRYLTIPSGQT